MSVKHIPQESAIFGVSHGKTRAFVPNALRIFGKIGLVALIANEIRGLILAVPVLYAMATNGMGWLVGFCSLAGVVLSVAVPWWVAKKWRIV